MNKKLPRIAKEIGAKHSGTLPKVGDGAFGMARFAGFIRARLASKTATVAEWPNVDVDLPA